MIHPCVFGQSSTYAPRDERIDWATIGAVKEARNFLNSPHVPARCADQSAALPGAVVPEAGGGAPPPIPGPAPRPPRPLPGARL